MQPQLCLFEEPASNDVGKATSVPPAPDKAASVRQRIRELLEQSLSRATRRAYATDWKTFSTWCRRHSRQFLPASVQTLTEFLLSEKDQGSSLATMRRRIAAIRYRHLEEGHPNPGADHTIHRFMAAIANDPDREPPRRKIPLLPADLARMVPAPDGSLLVLRDRVLLLLGWSSSKRRSELSRLDIADVLFRRDGVDLRIRRSKTDQQGKGYVVPIGPERGSDLCPVAALRAWIEATGLTHGPLLRSFWRGDQLSQRRLTGRAISEIVKSHAARAGIDPRQVGAHSLRAGFVTASLQAGREHSAIMGVTGHKSVATLYLYARPDQEAVRGAGAGLLGAVRPQAAPAQAPCTDERMFG